jgi:LPPG:FO 2-phospho-L-lactate transferase
LVCGGLGGARLAPHLARAHDLTVICNVADDLEVMGLHVSPDVDTVLYALAGLFNEERGFGILGDTGRFMARAAASGSETWFWIGDQDLATHVLRTAILSSGEPLSAAVRALARGLGVACSVIPASDDPVRTRVVTAGRELDFQAFYVREAAGPIAESVRWEGIELAGPAPGVLEALVGADLVVLGESSPVASVLPVLELLGVREALAATPAPRVALSPVVAAVAPEWEVDRHHWRARERLMRAAGLRHDPLSVAELYVGLVDTFVLDERDRALAARVSDLGLMTRTADLLDRGEEARRCLVGLLEELVARRLHEFPHAVATEM